MKTMGRTLRELVESEKHRKAGQELGLLQGPRQQNGSARILSSNPIWSLRFSLCIFNQLLILERFQISQKGARILESVPIPSFPIVNTTMVHLSQGHFLLTKLRSIFRFPWFLPNVLFLSLGSIHRTALHLGTSRL